MIRLDIFRINSVSLVEANALAILDGIYNCMWYPPVL